MKHSWTLNLASHTKAGSHFLDTRKKENWTQQHVYMTEKSIENRFDITGLKTIGTKSLHNKISHPDLFV